ncbi:MAG: ATP-binding protein [Elusimicrobia bacterium]|nr:ATP-binding protein [Elusimicrobiota bacterium]
MTSADSLKEIILSNEDYILNQVKSIVPRENVRLPESASKVCVFHGIRRSGKSFMLFDLFRKRRERAFYVDFEDDRLGEVSIKDLEGIREAFLELRPALAGKPGVALVLDEIQNVEGWEKFARRMVEREGAEVFVSGSSSQVSPAHIHTALRGRSWAMEVLPFSFREWLSAKGIAADAGAAALGSRKPLVKNAFHEYLKSGGFPETAFVESEFERRRIVQEYLDAMFFRDLVDRFDITNTGLLNALKDKLFSSFSQKVSLSAFCRQHKDKLPFSKDSAYAYYRHFLDSLLIYEAGILSDSAYKRARNPSKVYLADAALARRVSSEDSGRLLENAVYLELRRRGCEVFYFQGRNECDFVFRLGGRWSALQVAWRLAESNRRREFEGLAEACALLGAKAGTFVSIEEEGQERSSGVLVRNVPAWKWFLEGPWG